MGLSRELRMLLLMNSVSGIVFIYVGIFINLYIWEQGQSIFDVSWFNISMFISWGIAYTLAARLLSRWSIRALIAISAVFGAVAFMLLTMLEPGNKLLWLTLIGIPVGIMQSVYYTAQNLCVTTLGKNREIAPFFAATNIINQTLNMSIPLLAAQVIRWFDYTGSFVLMFLFLGLMLVLTHKLPKLSLKSYVNKESSWLAQISFRQVFQFPGSKWFILSCLATGFILQFQSLFALLFTFSITSDKTVIALLNTCYTVFALLALLTYRKLMLKEQTWILIGVLFLGFGLLLMMVPVPAIRIVSNIVTTVGMFYFLTLLTSQQMKVTTGMDVLIRSNLLVWRECLLVFARTVLLLFTLNLNSFTDPIFIVLTISVFFCLLAITFIQGKMTAFQKKEFSG